MEHVEKRPPFLKIIFPFCGGILWGWYGSSEKEMVLWMLAAGILFLVMGQIRSRKGTRPLTWLAFAGVLSGFTGLGCWITLTQDARNQPGWIGRQGVTGKNAYWLLEIREIPEKKTYGYKLWCRVIGRYTDETSVQGSNRKATDERDGKMMLAEKPGRDSVTTEHHLRFIPVTGLMPVHLRNTQENQAPEYGHRLIVYGLPEKIKTTPVPGGFDYAGWCAKKGAWHQLWTENGKFHLLNGFYGNRLYAFLYRLREHVLAIVRLHIREPSSAGIAQALLMGYRYGIDEELNEAYSRTGVVHIIAISGMHLAMIFSLLAAVPFGRKAGPARWIRNVGIGTVIWLFTLLTGAAPSITRAAVMLSLVLTAKLLGRRTGALNALLSTAFLMLAADPMCLWDIGFQLSFAAVAGLVLYAAPVSEWVTVRNPLLRVLWNMQSVNIAAQVLTTPLVIYHFHQFPLLFLFTNMVAVPVSGWVLYLEIIFCICSGWLPIVAVPVAGLATCLLQYMNTYIMLIARLPFCVWAPLVISIPQVIIMYTGIYGLTNIRSGRNLRILFPGSILIFFMLRNLDLRQSARQKSIIVHPLPGISYVEYTNGREITGWHLQGDSTATLTGKHWKKFLQPAHIYFRMREYHLIASPGSLQTGNYGGDSVSDIVKMPSSQLPGQANDSSGRDTGLNTIKMPSSQLPEKMNTHTGSANTASSPLNAGGGKKLCIVWQTEVPIIFYEWGTVPTCNVNGSEPGTKHSQPVLIAVVPGGAPPAGEATTSGTADTGKTTDEFPENLQRRVIFGEKGKKHFILPDLLVLAGGMNAYHIKLWRRFAAGNAVALHVVKFDGAFVIPRN